MTWKIEIAKEVPDAAAPYWHCRIHNGGLGYSTANDGATPHEAFLRAKMSILKDMQEDVADLIREMGVVSELEIHRMGIDMLNTLKPDKDSD